MFNWNIVHNIIQNIVLGAGSLNVDNCFCIYSCMLAFQRISFQQLLLHPIFSASFLFMNIVITMFLFCNLLFILPLIDRQQLMLSWNFLEKCILLDVLYFVRQTDIRFCRHFFHHLISMLRIAITQAYIYCFCQ